MVKSVVSRKGTEGKTHGEAMTESWNGILFNSRELRIFWDVREMQTASCVWG